MSQQQVNTVIGKKAIDSTVRDVGKITDITFSDSDWSITAFHLKIPGEICVELGLSKFKIAKKTVTLPPDLIKTIGDNVALVSSIEEIVSQSEIQ